MRFFVLSILIAVYWTACLTALEGVKKLVNKLEKTKSHPGVVETWNESECDVLLSSPELERIALIAKGVPGKLVNLTLHLDQTLENTKSNDDDSIVFSPIAIQSTLATILAASQGKTSQEISENLVGSGDCIAENLSPILSDLMREKNKIVKGMSSPLSRVASGIFVQEDFPISEGFKTKREDFHNVEVFNVNFSEHKALDEINAWTMDKAKTDILANLTTLDNLLNYGSPNIAMMLSTFHFQDQWSEKLNVMKTRSSFKVDDKTEVLVNMLNSYDNFHVHRDEKLGLQIIGLPNEKLKATMYVVLPNDPGMAGLRDLKRHLTPSNLDELIDKMEMRKVNVSIPRMDLSSTMSLKDALQSLGITSLFDPSKADLDPLSPRKIRNDATAQTFTPPPSTDSRGESLPTPEALEQTPSTSTHLTRDEPRRNKASRDLPTDIDKTRSYISTNRMEVTKPLDTSKSSETLTGVGWIRHKDKSVSFTTPSMQKVTAPGYELPKMVGVNPKQRTNKPFDYATRAPIIITARPYVESSQAEIGKRFDSVSSEATTAINHPSTTSTTSKPTTTNRPTYSTYKYPISSTYSPFHSASATPTNQDRSASRSTTQDYLLSKGPVTRRTSLGNHQILDYYPPPGTPPTHTETVLTGEYDYTPPAGRRTILGVLPTLNLPSTSQRSVPATLTEAKLPFHSTIRRVLNIRSRPDGFYISSGFYARECDFSDIERNAERTGPYTWETEDTIHVIEKWENLGHFVCKYRRIEKQQNRHKRHTRDLFKSGGDAKTSKTTDSLYAPDFIHAVSFSMDGEEAKTQQSSKSSLPENTGSSETFEVDRPFLFFIRDESTKLIWLWGTINKPTPFYVR